MSRKSRIILIVILIAVVAGALILLNEKSKGAGAYGANFIQERTKPKEITIRNVTRDVVTYTLVPYESEEKPAEKKLPVGAIDRVPASRTMLITYKKYGRDVSYSLYPREALLFPLRQLRADRYLGRLPRPGGRRRPRAFRPDAARGRGQDARNGQDGQGRHRL